MTPLLMILYLAFFTVVFGVYFIVPKKYRYIVLLVFSLLFFAIYSKFMVVFILLTIATVYFAGFGMNKMDEKTKKIIEEQKPEKEQKKILKAKAKKKKKAILICSIIFNLGILVALKYSGFIGSIFEGFFSWFSLKISFPVLAIALPIGISYYTLSALGYLIDVCRGKYSAETNPLKVALFISYFPQLFEGPFAKFDELTPQLVEGHSFDAKRAGSGLMLIAWGFLKKIVIADRLAIVVGEVFKNYAQYNGVIVVLGIIFFTFQLYAEFSGLIDIAMGISEMFGIKLQKNFEQPFHSQSIAEFWRRWHISLGAWFREYIFYPVTMSKGMLKLNKKLHGKVKPFFELFIPSVIALFAVWATNGLWHGAAWKYIIYGLYYYMLTLIGMCFEPLFNKIYDKCKIDKNAVWVKCLKIFRTFVLVNIGMLLFRANTLADSWGMLCQVFQSGSFKIVVQGIIDWPDFILSFICIAVLVTIDILKEHKIDLREKINQKGFYFKLFILILIIVTIVIFGAYAGEYVPPDPIYGGF